MDKFQLMKFSSLCFQSLDAGGFDVQSTEGLGEYESRLVRIGRKPLHRMMSPKFNDLSHSEAFGLILRKNNRDVGGVAARYIDLAGEPLSEYWRRSYARLYEASGSEVCDPAPIARSTIQGKVVYLGELFFADSIRGTPGASRDLLWLVQALCAFKWGNAQWMFSFVAQGLAENGKATQFGFTRLVPAVRIWKKPPQGRSTSEYLAALSVEDLGFRASRAIDEPELFFGRSLNSRAE